MVQNGPPVDNPPPAPPPPPEAPIPQPNAAVVRDIAVMNARASAFKAMVKSEFLDRPSGSWVFWFVFLNIVIYGAGVASTFWSLWVKTGLAGLAVADFAVGAFTFGMVLRWAQSLRMALAGSFFMIYLAFLGNVVISDFAKQLDTDLGKNLVNILTASVTAIVAFYFTAKTAEQAFVIREAGKTARGG